MMTVKQHYMAIIISISVAVVLSILWIRGIDYMNTNHPDYKGEDFLN